MTPCEQCGKAEATLAVSYQERCVSRQKALCDACARALNLPYPFTVKDLRPPLAK